MSTLGKQAELIADRGWKSEVTRADVDSLMGRAPWAEDARRVTLGRLYYVDLIAAVKRYARGFTKDERESLRTDALIWLTEHETQGEDRFPLGPSGSLPLRRDWLENGKPAPRAWRAMRAAIKQAAEAPRRIGKAPECEFPMEGETLGALADREAREAALEDRSAVILEASANDLAQVLGLPENAARALLATAFNLSPDECADEWNVSRASAINSISAGKKILASRYPDPYDLLESLRAGVVALSAIREDNARETISEYARTPNDQWLAQSALQAAREWQSGKRALAPNRAALISALVKQLARSENDSERIADRAARIADCIGRLLTAEAKRESDNVRKGIRAGVRGNVPMGTDTPLMGPVWHPAPEESETEKAKRALWKMRADHMRMVARRGYYKAHAADWDDAQAPPMPKGSQPVKRATRAPDAPMYETEAWAKGIKL